MSDTSFDVVAAVLAGLIAGPVMEIPAYAQRALRLGVRQDIFAEGGAILRVQGRGQRLVGYLGHAVFSAGIAVLYAAFFTAIRAEDHLLGWGLFGGLVHFTIGGLVVGTFRHLHPQMPEHLPPPGTFYRRYGRRDVLTFLGGHLVFAALVSVLYALLHPSTGPTAVV